MPNFLIATILIYVVSVKLGWLPTNGWQESWRHKILPSFTLSLVPMAYFARLVRAAMLEALEQDYVQAASAGCAGGAWSACTRYATPSSRWSRPRVRCSATW